MLWRLLEHIATPALRILLESLWLGAFAALLVDCSPAVTVVGALTLTSAGAWLAAAPPGASAAALRRRQAGALALLVAVVAALIAVERPWQGGSIAGALVRDVMGVAGALWLGSRLAGGRDPRGAIVHALRCCLTLVAALVIAQAAGRPLPGSLVLVLAAVAAAVLSVVSTRMDYELGESRLSRAHGRVLTVVVGMLTAVVAVAVAAAPASGPVATFLSWIGDGLRAARQALGVVLGWIGGQLVRLIQELFGLHQSETLDEPLPGATSTPTATPAAGRAPAAPGSLDEIVGWALALTVAAMVGFLVWKHLAKRRRALRPAPLDEHEPLATVRDVPQRVASRLASFLARVDRLRPPHDAADAVRREYRRLEHSLASAGHVRGPTVSVRVYLQLLPIDDEARGAAAGVAEVYERARYSQGDCGWQDVEVLQRLSADLKRAVTV